MVNLAFDPTMEVMSHCVRRRFRFSSCTACEKACSAGVFNTGEAGIDVDASQCVHCGNCLYVCPVDAICGVTPHARYYNGDTLVGPLTQQAATVNELLLWHREHGIRFIAMTLEQNPNWMLALARLNVTLKQYGEPVWGIKPPETTGINIARRSMFHAPREDAATGTVTPGLRRVRQQFREISETSVSIDPSRCVVCHACSRACQDSVILMNQGEVTIDSARCTGCGSCAAVCSHDALTLSALIGPAKIMRMMAFARQCHVCQREFWAFDPEASQCSLCQYHLHGMRV